MHLDTSSSSLNFTGPAHVLTELGSKHSLVEVKTALVPGAGDLAMGQTCTREQDWGNEHAGHLQLKQEWSQVLRLQGEWFGVPRNRELLGYNLL